MGVCQPGDDSRYVTCVLFSVDSYRVAIEARHIQRIDDTLSKPRHIAAEMLLLNTPTRPTRWLTLYDPTGPWQLGITGESEIADLPIATLHPLPPLLSQRTRLPALCGIALDANTLVLLLNGAQLSPDLAR